MQTVESIIQSVYGSESEAASALGVTRPAVSNWKSWGYFPARLAGPIFEDARAKSISLDISEIPTMHRSAAGAA